MTKTTIKEKILQTLLESPKKTGQIAIELGYINKINPKYGAYNMVDPDCKKLAKAKFIHEIEPIKKRGRKGTTYDIIYKLDNLKKLLNEYPSLLQSLQENDKIRSMIIEKFNYFENNDLLYNEFKLKLLVSPTFFKWCLIHDLGYLECAAQSATAVNELGFFPSGWVIRGPLTDNPNGNYKPDPNTGWQESDIEILFFACCVTDALEELQPNETTLKRLEKEFAGHDRQLELIQYLRSCNS